MTIQNLREQIKRVNTKPSEAQKHHGNYKMGHVRIHGLDITIENPKGSTREGKSKDGKSWRTVLPAHYGYIKGTKGADKDHVDCYLGPDHGASRIFVIDQKHHDTGKFDEHKIMIGYGSVHDAAKAYRAAFSDNHDRVLAITIMSIRKFRDWLNSGKTKTPVNYFKGHKK